ncbi:MAG: addiction module antidote protein, HigA family [Candidatus Melainabacteria bacterium GWF2_37_15]|nr:MAG: addiction module antidote protein, HigA family [Candidatus Melainabacteria bacterium GWF2_37_15]
MDIYNPCHPGEILREEYLKPLGLSVTEAALKLGITRKTLSAIINERSGISPVMALKPAKAFNTTPDLWTGMQSQYDLWQAKQTTKLDDVQIMYG